ncbi:MAG TPA: LptF/LptG family permease [Sphingomicrobium sp.]|nr:LptF/LptG family permease [Sphingomicrobium sp.]
MKVRRGNEVGRRREPSISTLACILDRYLFRGVALRLLSFTSIIIVMLTLENVGRLATDVQRTNAPFRLIGRLSLALIPEHLGAAVPVGLFLAIALTVRRAALHGEWQILSVAGMSGNRKLAGPFAVAALATGLLLVDRLEWRPAGEQTLDAVYSDLYSGMFGIPVPVGEAVPIDSLTTLVASATSADGKLTGVMVQRGDHVFFASTASIAQNGKGEMVLSLSQGTSTHRLADSSVRRVSFDAVRIVAGRPIIGTVGNDLRQQLDRQSTGGLLRLAGGKDAAVGNAALTALVMRIDAALFCLLTPWLGLVLGLPAPRLQTGVGIGAGILLIVAHLKTAAFVETQFSAHAVAAGLLHLTCWIGLARVLLWIEQRHGEGFAEQLTAQLLRALRAANGVPLSARVSSRPSNR